MGKSSRQNKEIGPRRAGSFPSPSSSSSSDFEFTVSLSPSSRKSSHLCPADELFYKGQLLPLHPSPRISMVRTLFLASSSTSSSSTHTSTTASRDSNGSASSGAFPSECDSSRPSSVTEEEVRKAISSATASTKHNNQHYRNKYFSSFANRFSSVFLSRGGSKKLDTTTPICIDLNFEIPPPPSEKKTSSSAKQVLRKYVKKVKPLYDKLSSKNQNQSIQSPNKKKTFTFPMRREKDIVESMKKLDEIVEHSQSHSHSFSGNLRFPRRKRCAGSCPSSMRSSPTHSGLLNIGVAGGFPLDPLPLASSSSSSSSSSSMEELQSAIQGAIAHCKSTMIQSNQKKTLDLCARLNHATFVM